MEHELRILTVNGDYFAERIIHYLNELYRSSRAKISNESKTLKALEYDEKRFRDGEMFFTIKENVRGKDVFVIHYMHAPYDKSYNVHDNLHRLYLINQTLKLASASRITNVIPYFAYGRQDRKTQGRSPISARLLADLIDKSGADRVLTLDFHSSQIQGFFYPKNVKVDNLTGIGRLAEHFKEIRDARKDYVAVAPDAGAARRTIRFANMIGASFAIINKIRPRAGEAESFGLVGDVTGKHVVILDDIVDSGGTVEAAIKRMKDHKPASIQIFCSHPLFSPPAEERFGKLGVKIVGLNTVYQGKEFNKKNKWFEQISVSKLFANAIFSIHTDDSVSTLFPETD